MSRTNPVFTVSVIARLLPAFCTHCLPSPCGRLSRPRTTTKAPPPYPRSSVASIILPLKGRRQQRGSQVPQSPFVRCRSRLYPVRNPALGPCRLSRRLMLDFLRTPPVPTSRMGTSAPQVLRPPRPFRIGEVPLNGASAIGSVSLSMTDTLAGPGSGSEVPGRPALTGSADLWPAGSTRSASPVRLPLRAAPRRARGLPPRKVTDSFAMKNLLSSSTT